MKLKSYSDFVSWNLSHRTVAFKTIYYDITNDLVAALLLSQIVYWFLPSENGGRKLRIERDDKFWLCKARKEWFDEIRITDRQYDRAGMILEDLGIIETAIYKYGNTPKLHLTLQIDKLLELINKQLTKYSTKDTLYPVNRNPKEPKTNDDKYDNYIKAHLAKYTETYRETFDLFKNHRKKIKKPMTIYAEYLMLSELEQLFPKNESEHIRRFKQSIQRGWSGVIFSNEKKSIKSKEGYNNYGAR